MKNYSTSSVSKRNRFSFKFIGLLLLFLVVSVSEGWGQVVISQIYGGGGNASAPYQNDFVEIFNRGNSSQSLNGWSIQYASATGTTWTVTNLTNISLNPGQYYLVKMASGGAVGLTLPTADATNTSSNMSGTAGKVILCNTTSAQSGANPTGAQIIDKVGFGSTANGYLGTGPTAAPSNTTAVIRANSGYTNTMANSSDFAVAAPSPRNSSTYATPILQASSVTFGSILTTSMIVSWTNGGGGNRAVFMKESSGAITNPVNNTAYTASSNWSSKGTQLGTSGYYCVYVGTSSSVSLSNLNPGTTYYVQVFEFNGTATGSTSSYMTSTATNNPNSQATTSAGSTPPTLTADATSNTVDNNIDITFPEDATWRGFVSAVKVGGTTLTPTTDYVLSDGNLQLKPSGGNTLLRTAGSKTVTIEATGYTTATVTQAINAGAANKLAMGTQPTTPASNGAVLATQPTVYIQDQYGNATTSTANITATVGAGAWTLGGTNIKAGVAGTATYTDLTATAATAVTGATISFAGDGLTGTTSAGFNIPTPPPTITVTSLDGFGSITVNTTSGELSYPVSAEHLTENLVITPPVGFEISTTSGSGFVANPSTLTLTQTGGTINTTTIYVRFNPATVQAYSTTITHTSAGATTQNLAVSGTATAAAAPTTSTATDITNSSFTANWGAVSGASGYKLDVSASATFGTTTTNTINEGFNAGTTVPSNWTFTGISSTYTTAGNYGTSSPALTFDHTNDRVVTQTLNGETTQLSFWIKGQSTIASSAFLVEGYNGSSWSTIQNITNSIPTTGTTVTYNSSSTPSLPSNITQFRFTFTKTTGNLAFDDVSINYNASTPSFLSGYNDLSVGGTSQSVTGLTANTTYYYRVRSTGGGATSANSNTTTVLTAPSAPTAAEETNNTATGFTATWALPTGGATSYALDVSENIGFSSFVSGYENLAVTGTSHVVSGLSPNTTYYYRVKAINATATATSGTITAATNNSIAVTGTVNVSTLPVCSTCDVVVAAGATLTVNENRTFNAMTVNPTGKLTNTASTLTLATLNLNSDATGTGTFVDNGTSIITAAHVQQYLTTGRNWYVSIPVTAADTTALSTSNAVKYWDEPTGLWKSPTVLALDVRKGYIAAGTKSTGVITFDGELNNGNVTFNATRTEGVYKEGFNLIGNPYPSYVNWESATKTRVGTSIWYRTKNSGGTYVFDTFNGVGTNNNQGGAVTGMIPPMQAVWVRVDVAQTTGSVLFTNAMRAHESGTNKLKAPAVNNPLQILRLQVSNVENSDEAIIVFNDNASNALDTYDSPKMTNSNNAIPEIYSLIGSDELVINGMNSYSSTTEIPVGFRTGATNNFSIKATEVSNFEDGTQIILKDSELTTETDITNGTPYTFASDAVSTPNRFSIIFRNSSITTGLDHNQSNDKSISVYRNSNSHIVVNCSSDIVGNGNVSVYNAIGQKLTYKAINSTSTVLEQSYTAGVYFVSVVANGKTITRKVIVD